MEIDATNIGSRASGYPSVDSFGAGVSDFGV